MRLFRLFNCEVRRMSRRLIRLLCPKFLLPSIPIFCHLAQNCWCFRHVRLASLSGLACAVRGSLCLLCLARYASAEHRIELPNCLTLLDSCLVYVAWVIRNNRNKVTRCTRHCCKLMVHVFECPTFLPRGRPIRERCEHSNWTCRPVECSRKVDSKSPKAFGVGA